MTTTVLRFLSDTTNSASYTLPSATPIAGVIQFVAYVVDNALNIDPVQPVITDTNNSTWTLLTHNNFDNTSSSRRSVGIYYSTNPTATPATLTLNFSAQTGLEQGITAVWWQDDTISLTSPISQFKNGGVLSTTISTTLDNALGGTTKVLSIAAIGGSRALTTPSGFTQIYYELGSTLGNNTLHVSENATAQASVSYTVGASDEIGTIYIEVNEIGAAVENPPVNTVPVSQTATVNVSKAITGISVNDPDGNLATTQLTVTAGLLNVTLGGGATISAGANNSSTLTLSGTQTQINAALATLTYIHSAAGSFTITVLSTDTSGIPLTDSDNIAITVSAAVAIEVNHQLSGAVTSTTAKVIARLSTEVSAVLEYSTASNFTGSLLTTAQNVLSSNDLIASFNLTELSPNTQYYYRVVMGGVPSTFEGKFKTFAVGAYSFSFAFSGDAEITDNQNVYDRIRAKNPDFFFALGDTPYIDSVSASVSPYQNGYKSWFGDTTVKTMLSAFPYEYIWDDHDYGVNGANAASAGKAAVQSVYRQHIPHYPLEVSDSIYHAFTVGRVRFLVTDLRSERSGSTFLGAQQMTWFKAQLTDARNNPDIGLVVWASSVPFISSSDTDTWFGASAQRTEIANHIATLGLQDNICIISADAHMVALDNGSNSDYSTSTLGGYPVFQSAPLNRTNSVKGGPYSGGTFASSNGQYSVMSITDTGTTIGVNVKAYNGADTQLFNFDFTAPVQPRLTISNTTISQNEANVTVQLTLSNPCPSPVTVNFSTEDSTALAGVDYTATSGTITFAVGEVVKTIIVPLL